MVEVVVKVTKEAVDELTVKIDDDVIEAWIDERLNDARNTFIGHMGGGGPSSPGDYPKTDTGRLANSVDYQMTDARSGVLYSDIEYAGYLTDGTKHMAPRLMLGDALDEVMGARPNTDELAKAVKFEGGGNAGG